MEAVIGDDADWENMEAMRDPTKSIGLSHEATRLRIAVEDLVSELEFLPPSSRRKAATANSLRPSTMPG